MARKEQAFHTRRIKDATPTGGRRDLESSAKKAPRYDEHPSSVETPHQLEDCPAISARGPPRPMIRLNEVMERSGKSRTTIWRDVRANRFPSPVATGPNSIAWFEDEIQVWQDNLERVWNPEAA